MSRRFLRLGRRILCSFALAGVGLMAMSVGSAPEDAAAASCANPNWGYYSRWVNNTTAPYYTALDYVWPGGINGRNQVLQAHLNWNYTSNYCGQPDVSPYASWWGGGVCCWSAGTRDSVSYRDVGYIPYAEDGGCNPASIACQYPFYDQFSYIAESDQRYNSQAGLDWYWGAGSIGGDEIDLQSVATHEAGHSLGLVHSNYPPRLVMNAQADDGSIDDRWLGWGDYTGMQAVYP